MLSTDNLTGRQPSGQSACVLLDQNTDETLHAAHNGAVQDHGTLAGAIFGHKFGIQALRQVEVDLNRAALPLPTNRIFQGVFDLGAVKSAIAFRNNKTRNQSARKLSIKAFSALSHNSSEPMRCCWTGGDFVQDVSETESLCIDFFEHLGEGVALGRIWSSVQKMWPSSCVKPRTRMMPCKPPEGSLRWHWPNSP
jgi:hypothetical protein